MRLRSSMTTWLVATLTVSAAPLSAQLTRLPDPGLRGHTHVAVGYIVNLPQQMFGIGGVVMSPGLRNWGLYVDYKNSTESVRKDVAYDPTTTMEEADAFGDFRMRAESEWKSFNAALVRVVSPALALYVGAGTSEETAFQRYYDEFELRGISGIYWVDDPTNSGRRVNVLFGAWFRAHRNFLFVFGAETAPGGATAGIAYVLPFAR